MPRLISSGSRSVLRPVSRLISDVLPWSICPAVPINTSHLAKATLRVARAPGALGSDVRPSGGRAGARTTEARAPLQSRAWLQRFQILEERGFVAREQAARIKPQGTVGNASDDRHGQPAQA